jgi:hypothetical protein
VPVVNERPSAEPERLDDDADTLARELWPEIAGQLRTFRDCATYGQDERAIRQLADCIRRRRRGC